VLGIEGSPSNASARSINHTRARPLWNVLILCPPPEGAAFATVGSGSGFDRPVVSSQASQEGTEGIVVGTEDAGDVFPEDPSWLSSSSASKMVDCIGKEYELKGKVAPVVGQGLLQPI
jgi:hypothetical protein